MNRLSDTYDNPHVLKQGVNGELPELLGDVSLRDDSLETYRSRARAMPLLTAEEEVEISKRIEAGLYAEEILSSDIQTSASNEELAELVRDGEQAKEQLILANLRLVISIAMRTSSQPAEYADLVQAGNTGLIKAVEKFDYTKGTKFSTYATRWIWRDVVNSRMQRGAFQVPSKVGTRINAFSSRRERLAQKIGREPTDQELAADAAVSLKRVREIMTVIFRRNSVSLETPMDDDNERAGGSLGEAIVTETDSVGEDVVARLSTRALAEGILRHLNPDERRVFVKHAELSTAELDPGGETESATLRALLLGSAVAKLLHPANSYALNGYALPWVEDAICPQVGDSFFFLKIGETSQKAKRVCETCPVTGPCAELAIEKRINFGIWGGLSPKERAALVRERRTPSELDI